MVDFRVGSCNLAFHQSVSGEVIRQVNFTVSSYNCGVFIQILNYSLLVIVYCGVLCMSAYHVVVIQIRSWLLNETMPGFTTLGQHLSEFNPEIHKVFLI